MNIVDTRKYNKAGIILLRLYYKIGVIDRHTGHDTAKTLGFALRLSPHPAQLTIIPYQYYACST